MDQKNSFDPGSYNHILSVLTLYLFFQPLNSPLGDQVVYTRQAYNRNNQEACEWCRVLLLNQNALLSRERLGEITLIGAWTSNGLDINAEFMQKREKAMAPYSSTFAWKIPWTEEPGRLQSMGSLSRTRLSDFTFTFHFHALEKEMATHSSVLAWRFPGMGEPGGLPSMGSHRVRHDWSDLAAAAVAACRRD